MNFEKLCSTCPKEVHCCRFKDNLGFTFLTFEDAQKIRKYSKKEFSYFLDFSPLPKKIVLALKSGDPSLEGVLRYSQLDSKKQLLRLKHKSNGDCIFLNSKGLCEIYSVRPNVCRIFPFWAVKLISGKIKVIPHDGEPECQIVCSMLKKNEDVELSLAKNEIIEIKKTFTNIRNEKN